MAVLFRRRSIARLLIFCAVGFVLRVLIHWSRPPHDDEIREHNVLERVVTRSDRILDVQRHPFLQARIGRDERDDLFSDVIKDGLLDYWEHFQKPHILGQDTSHTDTQVTRNAIEDLLGLNGWVTALCPTLVRPFGQNKRDDSHYRELARQNRLYYIAIVMHSADHFLIDQLAVIVQLAKRLGTQSLFVSMVDYHSTDATPTLLDLCEAVLILLGVPFRIRKVPPMTEDPSSAYYPLEEAYTRNLVLQPLRDLYEKRSIKFHRVVWLRGFTCPNDILELIKVSDVNEAAMVCGMDWAEHNGFYIFSDRWRTRDMGGDQFRQLKSSSSEAGPPRDKEGSTRYSLHLPFQVFCCESGTHVVDPAQSYYRGIKYRSADNYHNLTTSDPTPRWDPEAPCMDSSQQWFCRDLWVDAAREGVRAGAAQMGGEMASPKPDPADDDDQNAHPRRRRAGAEPKARRDDEDAEDARAEEAGANVADLEAAKAKAKFEAGAAAAADANDAPVRGPAGADAGADVGSDGDDAAALLQDSDAGDVLPEALQQPHASMQNSAFRPARILINPRCVTTYAGVSHTKLAEDLFGEDDNNNNNNGAASSSSSHVAGGKYVLDEWKSAPESFVCQEQRQTGGRRATKTQRRLGFVIHDELEREQ